MNCISDEWDSYRGYKEGILDIRFQITHGEITFSKEEMALQIDVPPDIYWDSPPRI
jgi:hypothetical protein